MPTAPIISIIIPCYNHGIYIKEAIESVERSAGEYEYEIIIVNDGSDDWYTIKVMRELAKVGYHIITQENQGLAAARNNGIKVAKGKYILPLDSDNKVHSNYFKAISLLEKNESVDVVYGKPMFFGAADNFRTAGLKEIGSFDLPKILDCNYIDACAIYRRILWEKAGGYDEKMPSMGHEDWELWINMFFLKANFFYLPELCFYYRIVANSMITFDLEGKFDMNRKYVYKKYVNELMTFFLNQSSDYKSLKSYIKKYKFKVIAKLLLGKKLQ